MSDADVSGAPRARAIISRVPHQNHFSPGDAAVRLRALAGRWADSDASERSSFQSWLLDFCEALGVGAPVPPTGDFCFELPIHVVDREGRESPNYIDCWKAGHFGVQLLSGLRSFPLPRRLTLRSAPASPTLPSASTPTARRRSPATSASR